MAPLDPGAGDSGGAPLARPGVGPSRRALAVGAALVVAGAWATQRVELVFGGPDLGMGALAALPVAALVALTALGGRLRQRLGLRRVDLACIYIMAAIGLPLAGRGFVHYLLPSLVTGFYGSFADPAGRYAPFLPAIPAWLIPGGGAAAVVNPFFEGGAPVPWSAWAVPLLAWGVLLGGLFACLGGLAGLLIRRWMEDERLRCPLADLPSALLGDGGLVRNRRLWLGAFVAFALYGVNGIDHYFLVPGALPTHFDLGDVLLEDPWRAMAPGTSRFQFSASPLLVGIAFLMPLEVAFSTWFFFLVTRLQLLAVEALGRTGDQGTFVGLGGQWREWPNALPHLAAQARGGVLCLAILSLWSARGSLAAAWRSALRAAGPERGCFAAVAGGVPVLVAWGWAAGLPLWVSAAHAGVLLLTAIGVARLRLDGGLPVVGIFLLIPNLFYFASGTGPAAVAPQTAVAFAFLALLSYGSVTAWLHLQLEGERLLREAGGGGAARPLAAGAVVGLVAGIAFALAVVHDRGLFALDETGGARSVARVGRYVAYLFAEAGSQPGGTDADRLGAVAGGAAVTAVIAWGRQWFLGSPFHPAGFVYATGFGGLLWGSAVLAWAAKAIAVRYGGAATYRNLRPFFFGLILGELAMRVLWAGLAPLEDPGTGFDW